MSSYEGIAAPAATFIQLFSSAEEVNTGTHFERRNFGGLFGKDEL